MSEIAALVADNLDIWTGAIERKSGAGRGGGKRISLYGIDRLRALILDLAVRGKLVPQEAEDEPASELLKRVDKNRARTFPKLKTAPNPISANTNTVTPQGWETVRLDRLANSQAGFAFKSKGFNEVDAGLPLIRIRDVGQPFTGTFYAGEYREEFVVTEGDYLISMDGEFRVATWPGPDALLNQRVSRLQFYGEQTSQAFVAMVLQRELKKLEGVKAYTTVDHLSGKQISETNIVLPPLAEQQRVVAKVNELTALCDALERESAGAMAAHQALVEILLATLVNSADATDLARDWARLERHFDTLFTTDASIDALKQTILDLAVRGKLVEQDARDEPAPMLLKRIAEEIADFCAENRITTARTDRIEPAQLLFDVPDGWAWSRLAGIFKVITDGDHQPPPKADQGVAFLTIGNVTTGKLAFDGCRLVPESYFKALAKYRTPRQGDILYTVVGATYGRPALVETDRDFCVQRHIAILKPSASMDVRYMVVLLSSPVAYRQASEGTTGSAQPTIALRPLRNFLVPIPPLAEQRRIVAKVDALMALCDALKARLAEAAQTQRHLADAITQRAAA
ncbi:MULTISPECIES: restriction endonuclease subunit S [unclassified Sphingomonas]|uniref:restriction endonuclease subunit S n=1 Tax=unclassified Sphingomonas TaxID=196159 RepID=UPI0006F393F0|nr:MULTISPECIES: restriction endonuclease subunit S [unclassified Sphingomonas]KQS50861.1 hypothetical protein ASG20_01760 [Sphingomonas sp. Leaf198]